MTWAIRATNDGEPMGRSLRDLTMPRPELFALVLEGTCPGCKRALEVRDLIPENQTYSERCGWCELCLWGWSATIATDETVAWKTGEALVTCYSSGALA